MAHQPIPFPASEDRRSFAVERHLSRHHKQALLEDEQTVSNILQFQVWGKLAVILVKKGEVIGARQSSPHINEMLLSELIGKVLTPPVEMGESSASLFTVEGIELLSGSSTVALRLSDNEQRLTAQRQVYINRLKQLGASTGWSKIQPVIPLATLLDRRAEAEACEWIEERIPEEVLLSRATAFPRPQEQPI